MAQRMICGGEHGVEKHSLVKCWSAHQEQGGAWLGEGKREPWHVGVLLSVPMHGWRCPTPTLSRVAGQNLKVHVANMWGGIYPFKCPASKCGAKGYQGMVKEGSPQSHGHFLFSHGAEMKERVEVT